MFSKFYSQLFSPLGKTAEKLYILFALISFFFSFFNDDSETNYLRFHWLDFPNLFTK